MTTTTTIPAVNPGNDLKFRVTTQKDDFNLARDPFAIIIKNRWGRIVKRIEKTDCYYDAEGRWYFDVEHVASGLHYAIFIGAYDDEDYGKQHRTWNDRQPLFVGREGCMMTSRRRHRPDACPVSYEQVWSVSVDGEDYLADCNGDYVYTSDGKRIQFTNNLSQIIENDMGKVKMKMTGDEFLQLIEWRNPDGTIDTLPEMLDAARGISDQQTIKGDVQEQIDENEKENEATDSDIDEIFDNEPDE